MRTICVSGLVGVLAALLLAGCATPSGDQSLAFAEAERTAWSLDSSQNEMIVSVSPARQTLQIAGSAGTLIGAGISAISNAKHRDAVLDALQGYDAGLVFEKHIAERLHDALDPNLDRVAPLGSTAGYHSRRDAQAARFEGLAKSGYDLIFDLDMTYGLFGYEGTLIAKLEGDLYELPRGHALWRNTLVVSSAPALASDRLKDPTKQLMPNITSPRLSIEEDAIAQWTRDGGAVMRQRFEAAVEGVVSATLTDLGLVDEALGSYYLGKQAMSQKDQEEAQELFRHAMELRPGYTDAKNGLSVSLGHSEQFDEAVALAKEIIEETPEYTPAYYNLAWWYAVELDDPNAARPYYQKALALGMPADKKIDKTLED